MESERKHDRALSNSPEQSLWQNVLLLVVQDALHGAVSDSCKLPTRRSTCALP